MRLIDTRDRQSGCVFFKRGMRLPRRAFRCSGPETELNLRKNDET
jgi:hypothetical protein